MTINDVDVAPLVHAELDRRDPDRPLTRPTDAEVFRRARELLGRRWAGTVARARRLPPERLHASVDGEWSSVETLRHVVLGPEHPDSGLEHEDAVRWCDLGAGAVRLILQVGEQAARCLELGRSVLVRGLTKEDARIPVAHEVVLGEPVHGGLDVTVVARRRFAGLKEGKWL